MSKTVKELDQTLEFINIEFKQAGVDRTMSIEPAEFAGEWMLVDSGSRTRGQSWTTRDLLNHLLGIWRGMCYLTRGAKPPHGGAERDDTES